MSKKIKRSPLFYVGDKYKLMSQISELFPIKINNFYEPFTGGGTVFLNIEANNYYLNDIDKNLIDIHNFLMKSSSNSKKFFRNVGNIIKQFNLSKSYEKDIISVSLRKTWLKTYFAKFNKVGYEKIKKIVNLSKKKDPLMLYILLIYGFNRMLRFNSSGDFNLPVGNVDFNKNVFKALNEYFDFVKNKKIYFTSLDFKEFFMKKNYKKDDFVYLDPPYLITSSEYNKLWNSKSESDLLETIDQLDKKGVKFALSNVTHYNGRKNNFLIKWMKKYKVHKVTSNYISYHNNSTKNIKEVLITNYDK
ncbi:MAG: Dam family site-specific DNA-(adenine-N6)-methyltransferase [Candidatus Nomurabacteria bacterium]|nr:Dam family site-specific DNA-(adenine-N6)-methyltransferase [Candidatus Nomurabacteria bacterium]